MESKWLEDFLCLAETRNFSRAAQSRHLTQSAFSRRIVALEDWMKTKLVDRSVNPVALTAAGRMFHRLAADLLHSMHEARNVVSGYSEFDERDHVVHFAIAHTLVFTLFPEWLTRINLAFGPFLARVEAVNVPEGVRQLMDGKCDLLIAYHHPHLPITPDVGHAPFVTLGAERLLPVSATGDDGRPLFALPGKKGKPLPLLAYSSGTFLSTVVEMLLLNAPEPYNLRRCFETQMSEALKRMVLAGHGIGWLPESCIEQEFEDRTLSEAGNDAWAASLEVRLYRSTRHCGAATEKIWASLTETSSRLALHAPNPVRPNHRIHYATPRSKAATRP